MRYPWNLKSGDVLGFASADLLSVLINACTLGWPLKWPGNGRWTGLVHVGICALEPDGDGLLLYEATRSQDVPCAIQGKVIHGVQAHFLVSRVVRHPGIVHAYRLTMPLTTEEEWRLSRWCAERLGTAYDERGAVQSRTTLLGWLLRPKRESLVTLFCSEFVAAALRAVKQFRTLDASRWNPNSLARELVRRGVVVPPERIGGAWQ